MDQLKTYRVTFHGRLSGALGITYPCVRIVRAADEESALLALYETHEHIHSAKFVELPDATTQDKE